MESTSIGLEYLLVRKYSPCTEQSVHFIDDINHKREYETHSVIRV